MQQARRQMPAAAGRVGVARGEAARVPVSDEACGPRPEQASTGSGLLAAVLTRENLQRAFKRVRANKGAAGVDGLDIDQTARQLVTTWPHTLTALAYPVSHDLNFSNRPVRTRMPGGVAGVGQLYWLPHADPSSRAKPVRKESGRLFQGSVNLIPPIEELKKVRVKIQKAHCGSWRRAEKCMKNDP